MPRLSPITTILLRECAGTGLAVAAFTYSGWITTITIADQLTHLAEPERLQAGLHAFLSALNCLTWWTGVGGLRLVGWRPNWPIRIGLTLITLSAIKTIAMGVIAHYA
ncbi:hypothetical protein SAMN04487820_108261 [Actinopolyspora mzabensis]|uniref:Uncharacterized protein n=1 Tax=Actinopolyspora mzabensis TaxID=995066 RepID=A0A1G9CDK7_ACTMZ|nr:hypothetical protein [Actinopolyspora mzabensis]SDK49751.1 hypothetical protein SAMN04487820_108261 [Actinopolyspora mzabensis]